jgi:hypothetical protein
MASSVKYHKTYLKLHKEYEAYAYPIIKKALDDQTGAVADFVNEDNFDNIELYIQFLVQQKPLYNGLEKIYTKVGVSAATFSYDWIRNSVPKTKKDFIIDFFNAAWYEEMVNYFRLIGGTKVTGIDNTTKDIINNLLANILGQNLSRRDQAKLFEETLNDPAFNRARSLVIARTESTTAANHGINEGARSSDYEVQKFWINTKDKRTRKSHLAMTMDRIGLNQFFMVRDPKTNVVTEMMYPGDVGTALNNIPASEVVNCRCVMATEAIKDADGLPILKPRTPDYLRKAKTYTDYPEAAVNNAKRALKWVEENGWGECGTPVGKARARQLANREPLSRDTIARMASFKRHQQHADVPYTEGCGGLMWDAWGGTAGVEWAIRKLKEIDND